MTKEERWLLEEKYGGVEGEAFHADVARLTAGEPFAYLMGHVPFLDCTIHLDSQPLIPRPETEFWVEKAIADIKRAAATPPRILDLCAGSGCIGVAVAKAVPAATVDFVELQPKHLPTIWKNLAANVFGNNDADYSLTQAKDDEPKYSIRREYFGQVLAGDLFSALPADPQYDYILTNPPYIDPALDRTEASVKDHEPAEALYGGRGGVDLITQIVAAAPAHLNPDGQLYLEHEPEQVEAIGAAAKTSGLTVETHTDQYHIARYSVFSVAK